MESSKLDYLLVATKFAKLSVIKWNFTTHNIETVSLHYYENFFENNSPVKSLSDANLITDPNNDCACMVFNDMLAFLPFRKDSDEEVSTKRAKNDSDEDMNDEDIEEEEEEEEDDDGEEDMDDDRSVIYKPTFIVPANKLDTSIANIIDCKFLYNYREPTLAILYAPTHTWAGNLKKRKDVVQFVVLSLDLNKKTSTTIISLAGLPYDLYKIKPLKTPLNGCLLIGCNELLHVDSSGSSQGLITNKYTESITGYRNFIKNESNLDLDLEGCIIKELPHMPKRLFLISKDGLFYWIDFRVEGRLIRSFQVIQISENAYDGIQLLHPSSLSTINDDLIFVGCADGDSLLLEWQDDTKKKIHQKANDNGSKKQSQKTKKNKESDNEEEEKEEDEDDDIDYSDEEDEDKEETKDEENGDDDDYDIDGEVDTKTEANGDTNSNSNGNGSIKVSNNDKSSGSKFLIADRLINCGPITNVTLAPLSTEKFTSGLTNPNLNEISVVASSGNGKLGAVSTFSPTIRPSVKSTLKFTDVNRIWTLTNKSVFVTTKGVRLEKNFNYLITTNVSESKSDCFSITENFRNVSLKTGFMNNELILTIGFVNNKKNIVQVTKNNVHLYDLNFKLLKTITIKEIQNDLQPIKAKEIDINGEVEDVTEDYEELVYGYIYQDYVLVTTSQGGVKILEFNSASQPTKRGEKRSGSVSSDNSATQYFTNIKIPSILSDVLIITGTVTSSRLFSSINNVKSIVNNLPQTGKKRSISGSSGNTSKESDKLLPQTLEDQQRDIMFLLATGDNRVVAFQKNHGEKVFQFDNVEKLTETLTLNFFKPTDAYPDPFIKQIMLVELGDKYVQKEYLTVLTIGGETYFYELFYDRINNICKFKKQENTLVTGAPDNAFPWGTKVERRLVYIDDFSNGLKCLFITGIIPYFVIKQSCSYPRVYKFTKFPAISFASFKSDLTNDSSSGSKKGPQANNKLTSFFNFSDEGSNFIFVDNLKNARICSVPYSDGGGNNATSILTDYANQLPITKIPIGESVKSIAYHQTSNMFIVSSFKDIEYNCVDEDGIKIAGWEDKPHAGSFKGSLKLLSPKSWKIIDEIEFEDNEVILTVKSMFLNTSSGNDNNNSNFINGPNGVYGNQQQPSNKRQKEIVLAGSGKFRMEDLTANGSFHLYDIIGIIPEIDKPEYNHKFKEIFQEATKGAVTALTEVSGRFLISQGQKVIVRDLQEDNTVVPVAFLDTSIYVSETKSFGNLLILGDLMKSIWLVGFDAEPYRMIMISKDVIPVDVNAADFISYGGDMYFLIGDDSDNLHLLQYNPEDPASLSGQRLVRKTTFDLNTTTTCMRSFPKRGSGSASSNSGGSGGSNGHSEFQVLGGNIDGSLYIVSPISEDSYRRMYVLQQQLIDKELHHLGLNPRMNRISEKYEYINSNFTSNSTQQAKAIIDFEVLREFTKLSDDRKKQLALKVGRYAYTEIWKDLVENNLNIL